METENSNSIVSVLITAVLMLVMGGLFFVYGLPVLRNMSGTQINVPDTIDVNINQQQVQ